MNRPNSHGYISLMPVKVKNEVCDDLCGIVDLVIILRNTFSDTAATNLNTIAQQLKEIKSSIQESTTAKSYAQAAAVTLPPKEQKQMQIREQREKIHQERVKYEVTLTAATATDETRKSLITMSHKDITERFQRAIDINILHDEKLKLYGISKAINDHICIQCKLE